MFLQPKKTKYKKTKKGKLKKLNFKKNKLRFGEIGLKSIESGTISARQIEAARKAIVRKVKRRGKIWISVFPNVPITSKPTESRMGKGKGSVSFWAAKISSGSTLFEICGIPFNASVEALKSGGKKLPLKTIIFN